MISAKSKIPINQIFQLLSSTFPLSTTKNIYLVAAGLKCNLDHQTYNNYITIHQVYDLV